MSARHEARAALAAEIRAGSFEDRTWMFEALVRAAPRLDVTVPTR
jgi:hypothetical protein